MKTCLSLALWLSLLPFISIAQQDSSINLLEFEVMSSKSEHSLQKSGQKVVILDSLYIANSAARSVPELLEFASAVDVRQRGWQGVQSDVSIRGGSFDQTLILLNGVPQVDPQTGHHGLNVPVPLHEIERIEVYPAGASRIYGANAFSGAINIITKTSDQKQAVVSYTFGAYNTHDAQASVNLPTNWGSFKLSTQQQFSDGFAPNTDFAIQQYALQWHAPKELKSDVSLFIGRSQKAFGASTFYSAFFPNQFEEISSHLAQLTFKRRLSQNIKLKGFAAARLHNDRFELFREDSDYYTRFFDSNSGNYGFINTVGDTTPPWYTTHNYHHTRQYNAELQLTYDSKWGQSSLAVNSRTEQIWSNNLGEPTGNQQDLFLEDSPAYAFYNRFSERQNIGIFLEQAYKQEKWGVSAGNLWNINTDFQPYLLPGADVYWYAIPQLKWSLAANTTVRFPTYTDLYYNLGGAQGSINLEAERALNLETSLQYTLPQWSFQSSFFYRDGQNMIDWIRFNGTNTTQAANLTAVAFGGLECSFSYKPQNAQITRFVNQFDLSYMFIDASRQSTDFESNYVLDFLQHKLDVRYFNTLGKHLSMQLSGSWQKRLGGFVKAGETEETPFPSAFLLDARVSYHKKWFSIFAAGSNLLDAQLIDIGNVPLPGIWLRTGVKLSLAEK